MNKLLFAGIFFMFGCGSITGYYVAKWDLQNNAIANSQNASATTIQTPANSAKQVNLKPPLSKRSELELKYHVCTKTTEGSVNLKPIDDKTLNDLVWQVCTGSS